MKKLSTEIIRKNGEIRTITVEVDDIYAEWLLTQPKEIFHDAVLFEYRTSCVERRKHATYSPWMLLWITASMLLMRAWIL